MPLISEQFLAQFTILETYRPIEANGEKQISCRMRSAYPASFSQFNLAIYVQEPSVY